MDDKEKKDLMDSTYDPDAAELLKDLEDDEDDEGFDPVSPEDDLKPRNSLVNMLVSSANIEQIPSKTNEDGLKYSPLPAAASSANTPKLGVGKIAVPSPQKSSDAGNSAVEDAEDTTEPAAEDISIDDSSSKSSSFDVSISIDMNALDEEDLMDLPTGSKSAANKGLPPIGFKAETGSNPGVAIQPFPKTDSGIPKAPEKKADSEKEEVKPLKISIPLKSDVSDIIRTEVKPFSSTLITEKPASEKTASDIPTTEKQAAEETQKKQAAEKSETETETEKTASEKSASAQEKNTPAPEKSTPPTNKRPPVPPPAGTSAPSMVAAPTAGGRFLREGEIAYTQDAINEMLPGGKNDEARDLGKVRFNDNNWYTQIFNEDFFRTIPKSSKRQTLREAKFIRERLGLQSKARVLDLCCGYGRHSIELSKAGYDMVGLDLSMTMLKKALKDAQDSGQAIKFIHGDMRKLAFKGIFDAIYCVDTSFGYFDDLSNFKVLQGIFRALKPGGVFLIETVNRDFFIDELPMRLWWKGTECMLLEEIDMDYITGVTYIQRSFVFDGNTRAPWEQKIQIRLYPVNEMRSLLTRAGFDVVELSGDYSLPGAFFGAESPRMIFIAEKPIK